MVLLEYFNYQVSFVVDRSRHGNQVDNLMTMSTHHSADWDVLDGYRICGRMNYRWLNCRHSSHRILWLELLFIYFYFASLSFLLPLLCWETKYFCECLFYTQNQTLCISSDTHAHNCCASDILYPIGSVSLHFQVSKFRCCW